MLNVTTGKYFHSLEMLDKDNKTTIIKMDPYLYGILLTSLIKKENKWHNMILVTGGVGDGKSTLVEGMTAALEAMQGRKIDFHNVCWKTEKVIELTDSEDNFGDTIWWDESIQGAGNKAMALTSLGEKLKKAMVTKRFKRHTYIFVIDEVEEYARKLIKMCDVWIHVYTKGLTRGFFRAYTNKQKILRLYDLFKIQKQTWASRDVQKIRADWYGHFKDYCGIFLDEKEYNKRKLEETKQQEMETEKKDKFLLLIGGMLNEGKTNKYISELLDCQDSTISKYKNKLINNPEMLIKFPNIKVKPKSTVRPH